MRSAMHPPDYTFLTIIGVLTLFGLIALSSASSVISYEKFGSTFYLVRHQILAGLIPGVVLFFLALKISAETWRKLSLPFFLLIIGFLLLVIIPGVGTKLGGARSWFNIGAISFQPSELAKLALILYLAAWCEKRRADIANFKLGFVPIVAIGASIGVLILLQPDVGTLFIVGAIVVFMAFIFGARLPHLLGLVSMGLLLIFLLVKIAPYRTARLTAFINPEADPQGTGYHINQALLTVGSGGMFGVGFGHSRQKFRYLPEVTGDSIFPIVAEEMGFLISAGFIILIMVMLLRMFLLANRAPDYFSKFAIAGIAGWFSIQSFVNISSMLGVLPLTGLPLPFISYGGTALAVELMAVGVVGSISRNAR